MTKKYIKDLDNKELEKVYHANEALRSNIEDDMVETEMHHISEQLDYLRHSLSDWSIGAYNRNYISVSDADKFIKALDDVEKSIPILIDEDTPKLKEALELRDEYRDTNVYTDEFDKLEEKLGEVANDMADLVVDRFTQALDGCSKEEYQIDYFIEFYSDARLDSDSCYIVVEDDNYVLHEDISYTQSYN